jgi:hypothetical protein
VTTLPTGETLPEYDDGPSDGADVVAMRHWLRVHYPDQWDAPKDATAPERSRFEQDRARAISLVITALKIVGDATPVKNATYRAMRKEGADIERLSARLANMGHAGAIVEKGGPINAAIAILDALDITAPAPVEWPA